MKMYEKLIVVVGIIIAVVVISNTAVTQNKIKTGLHGRYHSTLKYSPPHYIDVNEYSQRMWFSNKIKIRGEIYKFAHIKEGGSSMRLLQKGDRVWVKYGR